VGLPKATGREAVNYKKREVPITGPITTLEAFAMQCDAVRACVHDLFNRQANSILQKHERLMFAPTPKALNEEETVTILTELANAFDAVGDHLALQSKQFKENADRLRSAYARKQ